MDYYEYIKSPAWNKKRKKRLAMDDYTCQSCYVTGKPLDIHHKTYIRLGRERMEDLESLCRRCHDLKHPSESVYIDICQTCKERLIIIRNWLVDGWTRYKCLDGHVVEKKGRHK